MPEPRATEEEPNLELIHELAEHGLDAGGCRGARGGHGGAPRPAAPLGRHPDPDGPAGAPAPRGRRRGRHRAGDRPAGPASPAAGDPPAGVGHELRCPFRGGQAGPGHGGRAGRHGHLLGRGGDAERGAGRQPPLPLRARPGDVRLPGGAAAAGCRPSTSRPVRPPRPASAAICPLPR